MAEDSERHRRRATFDDGAQAYEDARPVAPAHVLDDLVQLAELTPGAQLLEIGCGTGQATLALAQRGYSILAVELGANLAEIARRKLADFPDVEVVTSSFEDWEPDGARFDAVVAFNSFHWIDPEVRFAKPASVLRYRGALGVYGTIFAIHEDADPLWLEVVEDEAATAGFEPRHLDIARDRSDEFTAGGRFDSVTCRRYHWDLVYDAAAYIGLMASMSTYRALDDAVREELFDRIRRTIDAGGGTVTPTTAAVLYVAHRA